MTLNQCQKEHNYTITSIILPDETTRERFVSLGLVDGAHFKLLYTSLNDSTFSIQVNCALVALRKEEAELISVQEC